MSKYPQKLIYDNILEAIGNTPLVRLRRLTEGIEANLLIKCGHLNPSGSIKDQMVLHMVEDAEKEGLIKPGLSTLLEASSGNTAQALSMIGAVKGYRVKLNFPDVLGTLEKKRALERYGAEFDLVKDEEASKIKADAGLHGAATEKTSRVKCLLEENKNPHHVWMRQFSNPSNVCGTREIGEELIEQTGGKIDVFVASIGTGGTFLGISQLLKKSLPQVKCVAVQPSGWEGWSHPLSPDAKYVPGISGGICREIRDSGIADEIVDLGNEEARQMAYRLSREEGIYCGVSSGANVFVALREARKPGMEGKNVVTVIVDRGDRNLSDERYMT